MNNSLCNSSSTEAGVLVAITGHGPTPSEGGTYYHWWGRMTREQAPYSPGIQWRDLRPSSSDLICTTYTAELRWNLVPNLKLSGPQTDTLPPGHRGPSVASKREVNVT
ncbi:hypothetical protein AVEN_138308-1 [Araneus ventricosus]|uniref:Uncharacterized protein n=1 Tax=Araneus ventricosus TaxID=182803 RepID=A0A4Y2G6D4_ARAVE|nr:hypothetical protein AVEN_138308-1 [Araneus ventricosus]